jgi:hypothetical protein
MKEMTSRVLLLDAGKTGLHLCNAMGTRAGAGMRDAIGLQIERPENELIIGFQGHWGLWWAYFCAGWRFLGTPSCDGWNEAVCRSWLRVSNRFCWLGSISDGFSQSSWAGGFVGNDNWGHKINIKIPL